MATSVVRRLLTSRVAAPSLNSRATTSLATPSLVIARRALSSDGSGGGKPPPPDDEWINSDERTIALTRSERIIMGIAVVSCCGAIAMFTSTKWEIERRVKEQLSEEDQKKWYDGTYADHKKAMEAARQAECDGYEQADAFMGARAGMVFKTGPMGLGYYPDIQ